MKVCHISDCHSLDDNRIFLKECTSLADVGYDVTFIAVGNSDKQNKVKQIGIRRRGVLGRIFLSRQEILRILTNLNTDVVHLHDPTLLFLVKYLKKKGKKVIFDSHEDYFQQIQLKDYIPPFLRIIIAKIYKKFLKRISVYLDGFIFPAENYEIDVKIPITVVGNSPKIKIDINFYKKPFSDRGRTICYLGGLSESRGITNLIKAAYNARCKLILAGKFVNEEYKIKCETMKEYSVVDYRGIVSHDSISSIINESRLGMAVLQNVGQYGIAANLATKVTEYCLYGLPVFLNDTPYNRKMVDVYQFGVCIDPDDLQVYSDKLIEYLDNDKLLEILGRNGRELVISKLNWEIEFNKLYALYKNIEENL